MLQRKQAFSSNHLCPYILPFCFASIELRAAKLHAGIDNEVPQNGEIMYTEIE